RMANNASTPDRPRENPSDCGRSVAMATIQCGEGAKPAPDRGRSIDELLPQAFRPTPTAGGGSQRPGADPEGRGRPDRRRGGPSADRRRADGEIGRDYGPPIL